MFKSEPDSYTVLYFIRWVSQPQLCKTAFVRLKSATKNTTGRSTKCVSSEQFSVPTGTFTCWKITIILIESKKGQASDVGKFSVCFRPEKNKMQRKLTSLWVIFLLSRHFSVSRLTIYQSHEPRRSISCSTGNCHWNTAAADSSTRNVDELKHDVLARGEWNFQRIVQKSASY